MTAAARSSCLCSGLLLAAAAMAVSRSPVLNIQQRAYSGDLSLLGAIFSLPECPHGAPVD